MPGTLTPFKEHPDVIEARFEQQRAAIHDPEIAAAIAIAKRYEHNTNQKIKAYASGWPQMVNWRTPGPGTATTTFTTLQAITPTQKAGPEAGANVADAGTTFHIMASGIYGTASTAPTMQVGIGLNGAAPTTWVNTAATLQASQTVALWQLTFWAIVLTDGSSGTIQGQGNATGVGSSATATVMVPATQVTALTWNSTTTNYFNMGASFGTSSASNSITCNSFIVLQYN